MKIPKENRISGRSCCYSAKYEVQLMRALPLVCVALIVSCSGVKTFTSTGTSQKNVDAVAGSGSPGEKDKNPGPVPQAIADANATDEANSLSPLAIEPAIVAGSFLQCFKTTKALGIICEFQDANKKAITVAEPSIPFIYRSPAAVEIPMKVVQWNTNDTGTKFYMDVPSMDGQLVATRSSVALSMDLTTATGVILTAPVFDADAGLKLMAYNAEHVRITDTVADASTPHACYSERNQNQPFVTASNTGSLTFTINEPIAKGRLVLTNLCGMDANSLILNVAKNNEPTSNYNLHSVPDGSSILIMGDRLMAPGDYTLRLIRRGDAANYDDLFFGNLVLSTTDGQVPNVSLGSFVP